jgi:hypothetical protein
MKRNATIFLGNIFSESIRIGESANFLSMFTGEEEYGKYDTHCDEHDSGDSTHNETLFQPQEKNRLRGHHGVF